MCLGPELLIPLALGAAGTAYNAHQTNQQQNDASLAASRAQMDNLNRQKLQGQRSKELFAQTMPTQARPAQDQRMAQATTTRETAQNANVKKERDYLPTSASAPRVVKGAQDVKSAENNAKLRAESNALARLGAWGDTQQGNNTQLNRTGGQIAENNSFVQGIAQLLPGEQNYAVNKAVDPLNPIGDVAITAGTLMQLPTFADLLKVPKPAGRISPKTGLGEVRG